MYSSQMSQWRIASGQYDIIYIIMIDSVSYKLQCGSCYTEVKNEFTAHMHDPPWKLLRRSVFSMNLSLFIVGMAKSLLYSISNVEYLVWLKHYL